MHLIFDLESNGLYDDPLTDTIWCIVTKDTDTGFINTYYKDRIHKGIKALEYADELVGHNVIDFDLRLIKKLYPDFSPKAKIIDTMILSQLLNPDRVGGHSLGKYGELLGHPKPEHEDWSVFSPEMLHRCTEDVEINHKVYDMLMEEAYEPVEGIKYSEIYYI